MQDAETIKALQACLADAYPGSAVGTVQQLASKALDLQIEC